MKRKVLVTSAIGCIALAIFALAFVFVDRSELIGESEKKEMYDGPEARAELEFRKTRDLSTGKIPGDRLLTAVDQTLRAKAEAARGSMASRGDKVKDDVTDAPQALLSWVERGPNSDVAGPFGNTRPHADVTAGRIRAIAVDPNDATGKTIFVGGVNGGIWKTTDITVNPPTWTLTSDFLSNMAIAAIAFDPRPGFTNIAYAATGESYFNADAVRGAGVFKSIDGGNTWALLPTSTTFLSGTRIVVDGSGNVYLAMGNGLRRSLDGGTTWSGNISPSGLSSAICDLEISTTGRLHVVTGIFSTQGYRYTDTPATVTNATWTSPAVGFPSFQMRAEIDSAGDTLYAAPANASYQVPTIYKSTDGGANWAATLTQPAGSWANGQGWFSLAVGINPANPLEVFVGGLDSYRSIDGGSTWTKRSTWVGSVGEYVHADIHEAVFWDNGNKLVIVSDGGVFYSTDKGLTWRDRNTGLRLKQFYSVAIHPTTTNYFLGGTQDNGTHQLTNPGLGASTEVTGGDGAFVAIDQTNPQFQFGAYVFNLYRRSTDGGATWSNFNFSSGSGQFINPFEYDSVNDKFYAADAAGGYRRWTNPTLLAAAVQGSVQVTGLAGTGSALAVSPFTANRLYLGTDQGRIVRIDSADTAVSPVTATNLSTGIPASAYVSSIQFGPTENDVIATISNYGANNVLVSANGGTTWTPSDGNLPDMPVRWAIFKPGTNNGAFIGTETGVWETALLAGAATIWIPDPTFPTVRVDMLRYRPSDGLVAAATHGRGIWTTAPALAAGVTISGRVFGNADGRGLTNASVVLTSPDGSTRQVITGRLGSFRFDDVPTGATYTISVNSRRFVFTPQAITVSDSISGLNFYPNGSMRDR